MKDVVCIYAQRADDNMVWEEPNGSCLATGGDYTGNTIAVIQRGADTSYDFSGCGEVDINSLRSFFCKVGAPLGEGKQSTLGIMVVLPTAPASNPLALIDQFSQLQKAHLN